MAEELGVAILELSADTAPLDYKLSAEKAKVLATVAEMQAALDTLHFPSLDLNLGSITAARATAAGAGSAAAAAIPGGGGGGSVLWGVRGPDQPGGRNNPLTVVVESAKYTPLGSLAAAVGEDNVQDTRSGDSAVATAADMAALRTEVGRLADATIRMPQVTQMLRGHESSVIPFPIGSSTTVSRRVAEQDVVRSLQDAAGSLNKIRLQQERSPNDAALIALQRLRSQGGLDFQTAGSVQRVINALSEGQGAEQNARLIAEALAARGVGGSSTGGPFAYTFGGGGGGNGPVIPVALGGAGGGGGNRRLDIFYHPGGGGGGGGNNGPGLLSRLLYGGGSAGIFGVGAGLAGMGSLASFGGLDPMHVLMTALGIAGSAGTAVAGAGLLGLGALGVGGAGMAADASSFGQAANDIKKVVQAQNQLNQAIAVYGKNSQNAQQAQAQLNATLGGFSPVARQAVLQAANTAQAFHQAFNTATGPAESVAATVINQGMQVGMGFLPSLGQAALTDANLIKKGLQPLFTWLSGPEGVGIFRDLEHEFTQNLPYGINALDNGLEAFLRIVDLASHDTGGFVKHIDDLLKKLNGMSNVQLEQVIQRLVGDFRVWEHFIKALGVDIFRLFNNDVGTGRGIIVTLTEMLQKLGRWEASVQGRQDLMTIFTVHKAEIESLLHILPLILDPLGKLYLAVAPAATKAMTDLFKAITAVAKALESIPGGSWILALSLLAGKIGIAGTLLGRVVGATGGTAAGATTTAAAEGAGAGTLAAKGSGLLGLLSRSGIGTAIRSGIEGGTLGVASAAEGAGFAGLADALTAAGAAIAPMAAGLLPLVAAVGGVYGLTKLFSMVPGSFWNGPPPRTDYTREQLSHILQSSQPGVLKLPAIKNQQPNAPAGTFSRAGPVRPQQIFTLKDIANTKAAQDALLRWYNTAKSSVAVSKLNAEQLAAMAREGDRLAKIFPKDAQLIDKLNEPIKKTLAGLDGVIKTLMDRWNTDATSGLKTLEGVFESNLKLISSKVGLSSHEGERMWRNNIDRMVKDVTDGMVKGRIATQAGMDEINRITDQGVKGQAITWRQQSQLILDSIDSLFRAGKISPQQFYDDLDSLTRTGMQRVGADSATALETQIQNTKAKYQQGNDGLVVDQQQLNTQLHNIRLEGNKQAVKDMELWVGGLLSQMQQGGQVSTAGANAILGPLNTALKELGQKPVSLVQLQAINTAANTPPAASFGQFPGMTGPSIPGTGGSLPGIPGAATGALYQIGAPGQAGRDTVPLNVAGTPVMVGAGEQVAVFNRHQQPIVNLALSLLGYDGMSGLFSDVSTPNYLASGGTIKTPHASGGGAQGSLLNAAFRMLGIDANKFLRRRGRDSHGSVSTAGLSGGLISMVTQIAKRYGWSVPDWLQVIADESGGNVHAFNQSSGAFGIGQFLPMNYGKYGPGSRPGDYSMADQLAAMASYILSRYHTPSGALAHENALHWYAAGGPVALAGRPRSAGLSDMSRIRNAMAVIAGLVGSNVGSGGDAGRMQELLNYWPQLWSLYNPNLGQGSSAYITTTDANGNPIPPVINQAAVNLSVGQLTKELGWEKEYIRDLGSARGMAQTWHPRVLVAIDRRRGEIARLRAAEAAQLKAVRAQQAARLKQIRDKIRANLKMIAAYQKQINTLNNQITSEQGKKNPNYGAIAGWRKQISGLNQKIAALEKDNQALGGAGTYIGTGGEIGAAQHQFGAAIATVQHDYGRDVAVRQSEIGTLSGYASALAALPGTVSGETGVGGLLGSALVQQHTLGSEIAGLQPGSLQTALAQAVTSYAGTGGAGSNSSLVSLLEQQNLTLAEQLAVSQAQYNVLKSPFSVMGSLPPFGGSFKNGGIVPGAWGEPRMILAHGGEVVTNPAVAGVAPDIRVHIEPHGGAEKWVDARVEMVTRKQSKQAMRPRPGQRAGLLVSR